MSEEVVALVQLPLTPAQLADIAGAFGDAAVVPLPTGRTFAVTGPSWLLIKADTR